MKFHKIDLQDLVFGEGPDDLKIVINEITDRSRRNINYELIFKDEINNRFYRTYYSRGGMGAQGKMPFEYDDDEVECVEVTPVEQKITDYIPVK